MKRNLILSTFALALLACGVAPQNAASTGVRCTSSVQCSKDQVCWSYSVSTTTSFAERGSSFIRDGYCGKL